MDKPDPASAPVPWTKLALNSIRRLASQDKHRLVQENYDLDLTYITSRIIAMGFPADTLIEQAYRNHISDVREYLEATHGDHYIVFNTSAKNYDPFHFGTKVKDYGWPDHHAPQLANLWRLVQEMDEWFRADDRNVAVVHCKAGKGRTGTAIAAYLVYSKEIATAEEAITFFGTQRSATGNGMRVPSQKRYVAYIQRLVQGVVNEEALFKPKTLVLKQMMMSPVPELDYVRGGMRPSVDVISPGRGFEDPVFSKQLDRVYKTDLGDFSISIPFEGAFELMVAGDIYIQVYHQHDLVITSKTAQQMVFRFGFHTSFISDCILTLTASELDSPAHGLLDNKNIPANFTITLIFEDPTTRVPLPDDDDDGSA